MEAKNGCKIMNGNKWKVEAEPWNASRTLSGELSYQNM